MKLPRMQAVVLSLMVCLFLVTPARGQLLDDVLVTTDNSTGVISLQFSRPVRYQRHLPRFQGSELVIHYKALRREDSTDRGRGRALTQNVEVAGKKIRFTVSEENIRLGDYRISIRFNSVMKYIVRPDRGATRIDIRLSLPADRKTKKNSATSMNYMISLASSAKPFRSSKPLPEKIKKYPVYTAVFRSKKKTIYYLWSGPYKSLSEARKVLPDAKRVYRQASLIKVRDRDLARAKIISTASKRIKPVISRTKKEVDTAKLLKQGKQALKDKKYDYAAQIFTEIMDAGESEELQQAHELLGLSYERSGKKSLAKVEYKLYLKNYPEGDGAERVNQRLAVLEVRKKTDLKKTSRKKIKDGWEIFGTWAQSYYYGKRKTDTTIDTGPTVTQEPTLTDVDQSSLISNLDVIARRRSDKSSERMVFSADHDYDFLDDQGKGRVRNAYYQYKNTEHDYSLKIGRQSATSGALSRFDGLLVGAGLNPKYRLNFVAGVPFDDVARDSERHFYGANLDMGTFNGSWAGGVYYNYQEIDGITDREAVGTELRYFRDATFLYNLIDYDVFFDDLNIFLLQTGWQASSGTNFNMLLDYRKSPVLQLSNLFLGESTTSIENLKSVYSQEQMKRLAAERTTVSQVASLSVLHPLSTKLQLGGDLSVTNIDGLPASGTLPATQGTGDIYTYGIKLIANQLFFSRDTSLLGLTQTDAKTLTEKTLYATERFYSADKKWLFNFDFKWYERDNNNGTTVKRFVPAMRMEYKKNSVTFEFEYGQENTEAVTALQTDTTQRDYYTLGYRWDF